MCQDPGTRNCSKSGMHPEAAVLSPITQQYDILDYTLYTEIHRSKQIQTVKSEIHPILVQNAQGAHVFGLVGRNMSATFRDLSTVQFSLEV